jgi:hypothetical protein
MARTENPRHHHKFYMDYDMVTILVDDCLFRVPKRYLQLHSNVFASMFALPQTTPQAEGQSDEIPIRFDDTPLEEFEAFLDMIYPHELGLPNSSNYSALTRLASATRWDSPIFRDQALKELAQSNDPVAQMLASRRFDVPEWRWPALFALCMRENHLSRESVLKLASDDLFILMAVRETLCKESITDIFKKERRVRTLLREHEPGLLEPVSSPLPGPRSGYQSHFLRGQPHPAGALNTEAPFVDTDGSPMYVGSARLDDTSILPCKIVVKSNEIYASAPLHGEQVVHDFSILHIDPARMKWVSAQEARSSEHLQPVEGGFDRNDPRLYYAYGEVHDHKVPGKATAGYSHAYLPWGGIEHKRKSDFFILVWRRCQ